MDEDGLRSALHLSVADVHAAPGALARNAGYVRRRHRRPLVAGTVATGVAATAVVVAALSGSFSGDPSAGPPVAAVPESVTTASSEAPTTTPREVPPPVTAYRDLPPLPTDSGLPRCLVDAGFLVAGVTTGPGVPVRDPATYGSAASKAAWAACYGAAGHIEKTLPEMPPTDPESATKGRIPEAANTGDGKMHWELAPDYIAHGGPGDTIVGYVPKTFLARPEGQYTRAELDDQSMHAMPVYAGDLQTLVGHSYSGIGFVPIGVDPGTVVGIGAARDGCMTDAGFSSRTLANGTITADVPPERRQEFRRAQDACSQHVGN